MALDRLRLVPKRPAPPPLLIGGLGLWLGVAVSYPLLSTVTPDLLLRCFWIATGGAIVCALLTMGAVFGRRQRPPWLRGTLFALLIVALCAVSVTAAALRLDGERAALPTQSSTYVFELTADAKPSTFGNRVQARGADGSTQPLLVELSLPGDYHELLLGTRLKATTRLTLPNRSNEAYYWQNGLVARASVSRYEILEPVGPLGALFAFRGQAIGALREAGGNAAPLMEALACGYRPDLESSGLYTAFQRTGLAHLVAVSGAHLTLVSMMLLCLLIAWGSPRWLQVTFVSLFALLYWVLAGLPISALRATIMMVCALASFTVARRSFPLNGIGLCILAFLIVTPQTAFSVSFGLSVGSTLGIVLFVPLFLAWFPSLSNRLRDLVIMPLGLTFASSVMTQPASAAIFRQLPLISPLANIIASPLFTASCVASLLAAFLGVLVSPVSGLIIKAAALVTMPLLLLVEALANLPWACVPSDGSLPLGIATSVAVAIGLWCWWPVEGRRSVALVAGGGLTAALLLFWWSAHPLHDEIIMLDIGQGDAFVLRSAGAAVMIDTGQRDNDLKAALSRHGVTHLDALLLTHGDKDHCGSMDALGSVCAVDRVIVAADALTCDCDSCVGLIREANTLAPAAVTGVSVGDELTVGRYRLRVVSPERFTNQGSNEDSLTVVLTADEDGDGTGEWTGLFSGDAEAEVLERLVDQKLVGSLDILKVAHHGSKGAVTDELLATLAPQVALVSVGADNDYGHPADQTIEALEAAGAAVWRSDEAGDVVVTLTADSMSVSGQRRESG